METTAATKTAAAETPTVLTESPILLLSKAPKATTTTTTVSTPLTPTPTSSSQQAQGPPPTGAPGARIYNKYLLSIYDLWVLRIITTHAWRCPTRTILLPHFRQHLTASHLDIGVGTGYYLARTPLPPETTTLTLLDLNPTSLAVAKARFLHHYHHNNHHHHRGEKDHHPPVEVKTIRHDVFEPLDPLHHQFQSISMFFLLHCLPGPVERKVTVFGHLKKNLAQGGVIYGACVLGNSAGSGVRHNLFGKAILALGNRPGKGGFFDNRGDGREALERGLGAHFGDVWCEVVGGVFMFRCREPIL